MNFKRILVLVMAIVMIVSACSPAIHATANAINHDHSAHTESKEEKENINYVSLGDSMTNGFGLNGYNSENSNGFLELIYESYPAQFATWLSGSNADGFSHTAGTPIYNFKGANANVTLMQLATGSMRPEDLLYALEADPNMFVEWDNSKLGWKYEMDEWGASDWTFEELFEKTSGWGKKYYASDYTDRVWATYVVSTYQSAIRDADIISLGLGNANFSDFLLDRIVPLAGFGTEEEYQNELANYADMTLENALALCEGLNEQVKALVNNAYNQFNEVLSGKGLPLEKINLICDRVAYAVASYIVSYEKVIDKIVEINPDVEIIIVPMINNVVDFDVDVVYGSREFNLDVAALLDLIYAPLNAHIAGFAAAKQLEGKYEDATFYYAELPTDANGNTIKVDIAEGTLDRDLCHERLVEMVQSFIFPMIFKGNDVSCEFTVEDVKAYEEAKAQGLEAFIEYALKPENNVKLGIEIGGLSLAKVHLISFYLGILDVILNAMNGSAEININKGLNVAVDFDIDELVADGMGESTDLFQDVMSYLIDKNNPTSVDEYEIIVRDTGAVSVALTASDLVYESLSQIEALNSILYVYGKLIFVENTFGAPSVEGHKTIADSLVKAYEDGYTVQDETIENIKETLVLIGGLVAEYYDEAYEYAYKLAETKQYTNKVVNVLDRVINRLEKVDLADNEPMTDAFKKDLDAEIKALIETLKEIKVVVETDKAKDVPGLIATLYDLNDDAITHLNNIYALCEQFGIDLNDKIILPALEEVLEVVAEVNAYVTVIVDAVVAHVVEKAEMLYNVAMGISKEVYVQVVKVVATVQLYAEKVEEVVNTVVEHFFMLVDVLETVYGEAKAAHDKAVEIFNTLVAKALEVKNNIDEVISVVVATYPVVLEKVYEVLGDLDTAIEVTNKVIDYVIYRVSDVVMDANDIAVLANDIVTLVYEILVDAGVPVEEAMEIAAKVAGKLLDVVLEKVGGEEKVLEIVEGMLNNALDLLLNSGLTYEQALTTSVAALTSALVTIVRHFNDIDNALDFTKAVLQTVYDYLVENRVEITEALKMAVDATKAIVAAIFEGVEDAKALNKAVEELLKTVYDLLIEAGLNPEEALKTVAKYAAAVLENVMDTLIGAGATVKEAVDFVTGIAKAVANFFVEYADDIELAVEFAQTVFVTVYEFLAEYGDDLVNALELAVEIYTVVVEFIIENAEEIELALEIADIAFDFVVEALELVFENREEIYEIATKIYAEILRTIDRVHGLVNLAVDFYEYAKNILIEVFGSVENAMLVAEKVYNRLAKLFVQYKNDLEALAREAYEVYVEILETILDTYNTTQDAIYTAKLIYKNMVKAIYALNAQVEKAMADALNGSYELKDDSYYVALGNSTYGEELAEMLNLSDKFAQFTVNDDYMSAVAGADLITIKVNNGEFYEFAFTQLMGTIAGIVRSNEDIMGYLDNPIVGEQIRAEIEAFGIDLNAQAEVLEWSKYLAVEDIELLELLLARIKTEVVKMGVPETIELDVTAEIASILEAEGLLLPGVELTVKPIVINAADLVVYAIENILYSYVQFLDRTVVLLEVVRELAPDAQIVITHVGNPLEMLPFDLSALVPEFDQYSKILDDVVDVYNVYLYALAVINENTIFVDSEDAADIYDALNVYCDHVYDDPCLDEDCNRCGKERVAPGHSFTHYVNDKNYTCTEDGTATAKCDRCDVTDTVTVKGSATGHNWQEATCTTPKQCSNCKLVQGKALGHKYDNSCDTDCNRCGLVRTITHTFGEWELTIKPGLFKKGVESRTCSVCGFVETRDYEADTGIGEIIALALGSIIVAFSASTAIILLIQKKREE